MAGEPKKDYKNFLSKIEQRKKFLEDKYVKSGQDRWNLYLGREKTGGVSATPFNIFYSNTEILVPAVFSQKPVAKVTRRFDEARADVPAKAVQRMLTFCMDTNIASFPDFMTTVEDSVLDAAIPGQGQFRVRVEDGIAFLDIVQWDKYIWGYSRRWEDKPWEAFEHDITPKECVKRFGLAETELPRLEALASTDGEADSAGVSDAKESKPETIKIYEVWDKGTGKVLWLSSAAAEGSCFLAEDPPIKLSGFFPTPGKPLTFVHSTTDTMPVPLYNLYKEQADELNEITLRLKKIVKAIKARGAYAGVSDAIKRIFEGDDNELQPMDDAGQVMQMNKGLDAYIWMIPVDKLITVARELYAARDQVKSAIYEILGIGDILRGVSKASETLGAQEIKDKWGSLRVNKTRERTSAFIREGLRLMAEAAANHTPEEMWMRITGIELQPAASVGLAMTNGQPAPPPEQTWPGVLKILQDDLTRAYTIDVETNSTVDPEATTERRDTAEFMNAFGQTMSGLEGLMTASPEGFELGKTLLISLCGKFDMGAEVEPMLRKLKPPQQGLPPEVQKLQQDLQKRMEDLQKREQTLKDSEATFNATQATGEKLLADMQREKEEIQMARDKQKAEHTQQMMEIDISTREALVKIREAEVTLAAKKAVVDAKEKMLRRSDTRGQPQKASQ